MIPLWQGSANTWDCDEMGHMNVRVYVEKAMEGLGRFAAAIGMPHAFRAGSPSTLIPAEQHIRFIREVHPGRPLRMTGCVISWDETSVWLYQDLRHADGRPAAAIRTRLIHAQSRSAQPFGWSRRMRTALAELVGTPPEETRPRGLDMTVEPIPSSEATQAVVESLGIAEIGSGMVPPQHCDVNGRMWAPWFMGRLSDSVPNLLYDWRQKVAAEGGARSGGAVLEYRLIYRKWPRAGDRFVVHTGLADIAEKTHTLCHWMLDPDTGEAWITSQAVAVTFDLDTRKVIPASPEYKAQLKLLARPGLRL